MARTREVKIKGKNLRVDDYVFHQNGLPGGVVQTMTQGKYLPTLGARVWDVYFENGFKRTVWDDDILRVERRYPDNPH